MKQFVLTFFMTWGLALAVCPSIRATTNTNSLNTSLIQERNAYTTLNALYLSKQYATALENLRSYLTLFPQSERREEILYKLAESYRQLGQSSLALETFEQLLNKYPQSPYRPYALLRKVELQMTEESLPLLEEILRSASNDGLRLNAQFQKVQLLQKLGRDSEAIPTLENLTQITTNNPYQAYSHLALGLWQQNQNRLTQALDHYRQALALADTPTLRGEAGVRAGSLALSLEQHKEAIALFETVRRLEIPETWRQLAHLGLLRAQYLAKDYSAVIATYQTHQDIFSKENRDEAYYYLANAFRFTEKNKLALQAYANLLKLAPKKSTYHHAARYERLFILAVENQSEFLEEAKVFLQEYSKGKEVETLRYLLAETYFRRKNFLEAIPLFQTILKQGQPKPFLEKSYYQLAWSYLLSSQDQLAIQNLEQLLQNYPKTQYASESLWQMSLAYQRLNQFDSALTAINQLLKNYPESVEARDALLQKGILLNQVKKWPESREVLTSFLEQYPTSTKKDLAYYYRGLSAFEQKDYPPTLKDLEKARELSKEWYAPATERLLLANYALKEFEKAYHYLQELNQNFPNWSAPAELLFGLGQYHQKNKAWPAAESLFEKAYQKSSGAFQEQALLNLSLTQLEQKKFLKAVKNFEILKKSRLSQTPSFRLPLAQAYLGAKQLSPAIQLAEQLMLDYPEGEFNAKARLVLAEALMEQKKFTEAAKYFTSVALLYEDTNFTLIALKQAAEAYRQAGNLEEAKRLEKDYQERFKE